MRTLALLSLSLAAAPLALALADSTESAEERALRAVDQQRLQAYVKGDSQALARIVDDDFRYTGANGDWLDKPALIALSSNTARSATATHDDVRVRVFGDVALVHGLLVENAAEGTQSTARYTDVYRRSGRNWRLVSSQFSNVGDGTAITLTHQPVPHHRAWDGTDPTGDDEHVLRVLNSGYVQAFLDSNVGWYDRHLAPDYLVVFGDGSFHDKSSLLAAAAHPVTNMKSFPTTAVSIRRFGDVALIHAQNPYERTDGLEGINRYTDIWHKRNGQWICIAAHVTRHKLPSRANAP